MTSNRRLVPVEPKTVPQILRPSVAQTAGCQGGLKVHPPRPVVPTSSSVRFVNVSFALTVKANSHS